MHLPFLNPRRVQPSPPIPQNPPETLLRPPPNTLPQSFFQPKTIPPPLTTISISNKNTAQIFAAARLPISSHQAFSIITTENPERIFKNASKTINRTLIENGSSENVKVELIKQSLIWRFLFLKGSFVAKVLTMQCRRNMTIKYSLVESPFMKQFEGEWAVLPLVCEGRGGGRVCRTLEPGDERQRGRGRGEEECIVMNWQRMKARIMPPPGLKKYVAGIIGSTMQSIFEDLTTEAKRIRKGGDGRVGVLVRGKEDLRDGGERGRGVTVAGGKVLALSRERQRTVKSMKEVPILRRMFFWDWFKQVFR